LPGTNVVWTVASELLILITLLPGALPCLTLAKPHRGVIKR
jgi:hypothetical protein